MRHSPTFAFRLTTWSLAMALVVCLPAFAQRPRPDRPYRGLFGGNGANPNSSQQLDVNVSLFAAYDDNVLATTPQGVSDPRFQQSGGYGSGTVSLDYTKKAGKATFDFAGGTGYRYYRSLEELNGFNSFLTIGMSAQLAPKTDFRISATGNYTPYYSFSPAAGIRPPAPGDLVPNNPDNPLAEQPALNLSTSGSLTQRFTPRSSLSGDYTFAYTDYSNLSVPYQNWGAGASYAWRASTRTNVNASYHYRRGTSGLYYQGQAIDTHEILAGLRYTRRLSPSRTMTVGFNVGPSIYRAYLPPASVSAVAQQATKYPVIGNASASTQLGRSWSLGVNYSRGVQYTQGFGDPFFSNYVSAAATGFVGDRSLATFSVGYNTGSVGLGVSGQGYDTATASARYQYALTRWAALFVNYGYYHYLFDQSVALPAALARGQDRNSISVGVNLWAPLLR